MALEQMEHALSGGVDKLVDLSTPFEIVLILVIACLCWFIRELLKDAKEERKSNRDALIGNTAILSELKELIRGAINR